MTDMTPIPTPVSTALPVMTTEGLVRVCSWCRRVWTITGWETIGEAELEVIEDMEDVTHGCCPECLETNFG